MAHVNKRKIVYNTYRDMLKNYNDRANEILESKPASCRTEDHGVEDRIISMMMQQTGAPPPPPPPPPPVVGNQRLRTEIPAVRAEPPACVQNAMMTKDKKPFTYTPGGLDLSQIRSPRMARRLTRNANSEGNQGQPACSPSQLMLQQMGASNAPQVAPQVAPQMASPAVQSPMATPVMAPPPPPMPEAQRPHVVIPPPGPQGSPQNSAQGSGSGTLGRQAQVGSIYVPPLDSPVTLNKAPTPWLTRSPPQPEPQPAWVTAREQATSVQSPQSVPVTPSTPSTTGSAVTPGSVTPGSATPGIPSTPATPGTPMTPQSPQKQFRPQQNQQPPFRPQQQGPATRVVPIQIQMSPQGPQQYQQVPPQYQPMPQQYQQVPQQYQVPQQPPQQFQQPQGPVTRIIPIQLETDTSDSGATFHPVQSPAFRVLQKMTSREDQGAPSASEQLRKMQLSEDDRALMNKLRTQVDDETFLHSEADPRYRGAAIPSRAFRILQHMTDGDGMSDAQPRRQPSRAPVQVQVQVQVPASEQQAAQEPRKYTGGAIPSRSFQMLQAMVAPDACAQGAETDTESSDCYPYYYPQPVPYWHDPYWAYQHYYPEQMYQQQYPSQQEPNKSPQEGTKTPQPEAESNTQYQYSQDQYQYPPYPYPYYGYDYGYYPYPYGYAYDPYTTSESEFEPPNEPSVPPSETETEVEAETETETETEQNPNSLQAIRSVTDIHRVYDTETTEDDDDDDKTECSDHEEDTKDEEEEETDEETDEDHVPHQLSVIFEESDLGALSDATDRRRETSVASEDDSSTTIAVESGDEEETVTVRLPLRFKFTKTENDEDVTTVIVGDSQVDKSNTISVTVNIPSPVSRSLSATSKEHEVSESEESESEDSDSEEEEEEEKEEEPNATVTVTLVREEESGRVSVRDRIMAIERSQSKTEEASEEEEEADSGVTSQTDTESECFQEIRRMNKYQRAATHSRLFKLLSDGCRDDSDDEEEEDVEATLVKGRQQLSLPLNVCSRSSVPDSFSSGIASPASTPPRRTRSAATSEMSTPGEYGDYSSYYSSWEDRTFPSRTSPYPRCPMTPLLGVGDGDVSKAGGCIS